MKGSRRRQQGKSSLELIEETVHLLRTAPLGTLAIYCVGTTPFLLALLYFWADMSRSPFAVQHLPEAALSVAALFLWMKFWQAIFAARIRAQIAGEPAIQLNVSRCLRIASVQIILQPLGLAPIGICLALFFFFVPLGLMLTPIVWLALSFFHNVNALAAHESADVKTIFKKAWRQWSLWPGQNIVLLAIIGAFGFYVFLNWAVVCLYLPNLIKTFFGIESTFTRSPFALLNTTLLATMLGLTYLCVDPILKTLYALRCFYGEALDSGEDLKTELKRFSLPAQKIAAVLICLLLLAGAISSRAADATPAPVPASGPAIPPAKLDRAIDQTIHERKYTWRLPRETVSDTDEQEGAIARFFERIGKLIRKWVRAVMDWWQEFLRKLFRHHRTTSSDSSGDYGWIMATEVLLYALVAAAIAALVIFLYRIWRGRSRQPAIATSEAISSMPDVADENVGPDQLPEDGWTQLARELLGRGEFRLAMRAFYLASLAHLAQRNLISVARFKSNHDYERELRRRAHSFPELLALFGENVSVFERIWYGTYEANAQLVDGFAANVERMKRG